VLAVQRVVKVQDRESIRNLKTMVAQVIEELGPVEDQWGVQIHEFGFSTFSPTPETLEITQLRKLAEEKLSLYQEFHKEGLGVEAAVALISGSVVALRPSESVGLHKPPPGLTAIKAAPQEQDEIDMLVQELEDGEAEGEKKS
jgi:hypothetical protein